ncbi:Protein of uncharacterised function (DUF2845) (plasmid) [Legionella adelaidensis]|uniref:Protein of uncharacterized function (DUF2845) n=1 Tax=Legionella adelaidensis TaxID=45056 RepID=A0A0W0R2Y3_9GAMM|nr:DUF2845 domain-containing protein [Legionella adelaidensis]KTC65421.1 hypothetical protein Lade_0079 [Legionella adelaidensis]VEH84757.1 Protein of uncharacterised function (DUF2845) [Legionella adelaidensis]
MKTTYISFSLYFLLITSAFADSFYCPQHSAFINIGMTQDQVVAACGVPLSKQASNAPVTQRVPVKQLIYTTLNQGAVYPGLDNIYNMWSIPSGQTGVNVEVDIIDNKVANVRINGSSSNAVSLCGGTNIEIGSAENLVYQACGNPTMVNNTYINQPVPSNSKPEVWVYQVDQFHSPYSLTFVNGKLESID